MDLLYPRCAGLDVHPRSVSACTRIVVDGRVIHEVRTFGTSTRELSEMAEWLAAAGCTHVAMEATGVLELADLPLDQLSGGERQRAFIARALAQDPRLLVLDEPTAHLDLRYQVEVASLLRRLNRERGIAILLVSHDLNLAGEVCDRLMLLALGRAAATGTPEVVLEESLLSSVFGCDVVVDKGEPGRRPLVRLTWRA